MLCFGLIILFAGANLALPSSKVEFFDLENAAEYFEQFITDFGREYKDENEKNMRFENFKNHLLVANLRNIESDGAVHGITKFADYTNEEKMHLKSCYSVEDMHVGKHCPNGKLSSNITDVPSSFDWRDQGIVSPVKDQAQCGSCWAFSSIGNVESAYAKKYGKILDLSEQELVDCDVNSFGCGGAQYTDAGLSALLVLGGAESESDYPYIARDQKCQFDTSKVQVKLASCTNYKSSTADLVKQALVEAGPLSIGVDATGWDTYTNGVYDCRGDDLDHAVLLVGYGSDGGKDFWIIKNSWGPSFGENGYIRVSQQYDCGLTKNPVVGSVVA